MHTISTIPVSLTQKFYEFRKDIKSTFRSFLNNKYQSFRSVRDIKRLKTPETDFFAQLELLDLPTAVSVLDLNGIIIRANAMFCRISGYTLNELLFNSHTIIQHPDTHTSEHEEIWATITRGKIWEGELKNVAKNKSTYWTKTTIAPLLDDNGDILKYISMQQDITAQKQEELKLKKESRVRDHELEENIEYAKHIHDTFLTGNNDIANVNNDVFVLYKAKKVISGDFYKIEKEGNELVFILGDSTGHGVSASYISILALNAINRALKLCSCDPSEILKGVNNDLNQATRPKGKRHLRESADVMACSLDTKTLQLRYASANVRGFVIRKGEVILLGKEKCSLGEASEADFVITNKTMELEKDDCVYVFSDGLTDQFGGPKDKRIGMKNIIELAKKMNSYSMTIQKKVMEIALVQWQMENEQTDDIILMGIRV